LSIDKNQRLPAASIYTHIELSTFIRKYGYVFMMKFEVS